MKMCPLCGNTIMVDPDSGKLLTHGPETKDGPYDICSGSGLQVEPPKEDEVTIAEQKEGKSYFFHSRGMGNDSCKCFVCGEGEGERGHPLHSGYRPSLHKSSQTQV